MQQLRSVPLPLKRPTRQTDELHNRQAVIHQKATASSDTVAGYWEREQATGKGSRLLGKGAGYWEREQATGKGSRLLGKEAHLRPEKAAARGNANMAGRLALNRAGSCSSGGHLFWLSSTVSSMHCPDTYAQSYNRPPC